MASNDQVLKLLVKVEGELSKLNEVKKGIDDLKANLGSAGQSAQLLGTALGIAIPTTFIGALTAGIAAVKAFEAAQQAAFEEMERGRERIRGMEQDLLDAQEAFAGLARLKTLPLTQQIQELEQALIRLKTEQALVNQAMDGGVEAAKKYQDQINATTTAIEALKNMQRGAVQALKDTEALDFARAYGTQTDINKAKLIQLTDQVLAAHRAVGTEISRGQAEQIAKDQIRAEEQDKIRAEAEREANARDSITPMLRDQATLLQNIRQNQQLISEAPFMGADAKQVALLASSKVEMQNIARAIGATQAALKGSGLDATQYEQLEQRLQLLRFRFQQLGQQIPALGFGGGLRAELTQWANSFGTTATQVGKTIEGTIGASLQAVNQFLVTGKFNAQALLQQLVMLGLQLVEQMIIQRVMAAINAAAAAGQAAATGPVVAAAWAPAATAATIATQGAAAVQAPAAVAGALAAIMGTLVIAHEGGPIRRRRRFHDGGLADDEVPIIAQEGEIVIQRSVAQREGMAEYLLALNAGMLFHRGGDISAGFTPGARYHRGSGEKTLFDPLTDDPREFGGTPSWYTSPRGQGPIDTPYGSTPYGSWFDPTIEPGDLDFDTGPGGFGQASTIASGMDPQMHQYLGFQFGQFASLGYLPPVMTAGYLQGPTMIPTTFNPQGYPYAVPVGWSPTGSDYGIISGSRHMGVRKPKHEGGLISDGGSISRYHDGGSIGIPGAGKGAPGIHIYAFTDLKALTRHMAGKEGQKIIFDTVKGRRIDLGMK
jgi:hypothetical protein